MLLEYGFRNFFSFREGAQVSFRLDSNCPQSISDGRDAATVMVVEGNNAAGKTHVLKAISFLARFAAFSFSSAPDSLIAFSSFFDNENSSELYAEFRTPNGVEYRYEIELTDREVIRETIYKTVKRRTVLIERLRDRIVRPQSMADLEGIILRKNASVISIFNQYGRAELSEVYDFFASTISNVGFLGYNDLWIDIDRAAALFYARPKMLEFAKDFIKKCDTGVEDIEITQNKKTIPGKKEEQIEYTTFFYHLVDGNRKPLLIESQSSGTKALFRALGLYFLAISTGKILIYDEFDTHLHPHIIPEVVNLFTDPTTNIGNGQLIVSSHSDRLIDTVGRYRSVLVNKENNESYLYRLDELPGDLTRNDRSMLPAYHEGKLGGVPRK